MPCCGMVVGNGRASMAGAGAPKWPRETFGSILEAVNVAYGFPVHGVDERAGLPPIVSIMS